MWIEAKGIDAIGLRVLTRGAVIGRFKVLGGDLSKIASSKGRRAQVLERSSERTVISLKDSNLAIEPVAQLQPGTDLVVRLATGFPETMLELRTPFSGHHPAPSSSSSHTRVLVAQVVRLLPEGRVLLDLDGALLEVEAPTPLSVGARLQVRVEPVNSRIFLKIDSEDLGRPGTQATRTTQRESSPPASNNTLSQVDSRCGGSPREGCGCMSCLTPEGRPPLPRRRFA
jgi:hypothetical protein